MASIDTYPSPTIEDSSDAEAPESEALTHEQLAEISDLYMQEYPRMVHIARRYHVRDPEATAQTAFAKALKGWNKYEYQGLENGRIPWLKRITINTALDEWRRKKRIEETPSSDTPVFERHQDAGATSDFAQIEENLYMEKDLDVHIRELVPDKLYKTFSMVALEGMSYQEVADTLGISLGTVRSRIHRVRAKLANDPRLLELAARQGRITGNELV